MEVVGYYIYLGGGGGYEIKNKIEGYELPAAADKDLLKKSVHQEITGDAVCNYMQAARDVSFSYRDPSAGLRGLNHDPKRECSDLQSAKRW